jgi:hypothetical protein
MKCEAFHRCFFGSIKEVFLFYFNGTLSKLGGWSGVSEFVLITPNVPSIYDVATEESNIPKGKGVRP